MFGRSTRDSNCDCDRSMEPSLLQTVFLQNDSDMLRLLDDRQGWIGQVARDQGAAETPQRPVWTGKRDSP